MRFAKRHEAFMQQRLLDTLASDANGRFQLSDIGETIEYATIVVQAPGFGLSGGYLPKGTSSEDPGEIRVHPASKLKLKFIDPDGKPAGSLRVRLAGVGNTSPANRWTIEFPDSMADSFTQTADADGVCTFPDLPQSGVAWVEPLDDRYVGLGWRQKFDLKDDEISDAGTIKLKPAGSISGQVTFADSKAPAAGVRILVRARDYDSGVQDTTTDAQGHYELKQLASGSYSMVPYLSKEMAESYASGGRDGVRVLPGLPVQNQDFTLVAGGVVRGKVAEKTSGKPLANMQIFIDAASRPFVGYTQDATTREDGTYLVHVPPGKVRVQFALPIPKGYLEPKPLSRELTIADNQTVNVNFDVPSNPMAPISGRTVDAAGHPLAGVEILGQGSDDYPPGYSLTFSDAEGNFTLPGIDPGTTLRARRGRWTTVQPVTAAAGARNLAITLRNDAAISIRAHIADADGKPIASAKVELTSSRPKRPGYIYHDEKSTAPDGTCLFKSVNPDMEYRLVVEAKGFGPTDAKLTLEPGKLIDAPVIKLVRADSFISGIVMDDQGNPVPDADVQASSGGPRSESLIGGSRRARSGITGSFRIEEILPGDVLDVRAWTDDGKAGDTLGVPAGSENIVITIKPRPAPR
jgi:protocatechuate 3,4-dioxygenase beta subunit